MMDCLSEFIAFISGMALILITWYVSSNDDRRKYRLGYKDGLKEKVNMEAERMIELEPCPFCGGLAHLHTDVTEGMVGLIIQYPTAFVSCDECGARTTAFDDTNHDGKYVFEAIDAWNRRIAEHGNELNIRDVHGRSNIPAV